MKSHSLTLSVSCFNYVFFCCCCSSKTRGLICHYANRYGYKDVTGNHCGNRNNYEEEEEQEGLIAEDNGQEMETEETADARKRWSHLSRSVLASKMEANVSLRVSPQV